MHHFFSGKERQVGAVERLLAEMKQTNIVTHVWMSQEDASHCEQELCIFLNISFAIHVYSLQYEHVWNSKSICSRKSGVQSTKKYCFSALSTMAKQVAKRRSDGWVRAKAQQTLVQPNCGKPASWALPKTITSSSTDINKKKRENKKQLVVDVVRVHWKFFILLSFFLKKILLKQLDKKVMSLRSLVSVDDNEAEVSQIDESEVSFSEVYDKDNPR